MVLLSSVTSAASFTRRTVPVPPQVGQAPPLLKASSSAPGPKKVLSAGCARDRLLGGHRHGGRGVRCRRAGTGGCPRALNSRRRLFSSSVHGAEGAAHAGDARALVQREGGGDVAHLVDVGARGLPHAAARVGGQRLQVATRAFRVQTRPEPVSFSRCPRRRTTPTSWPNGISTFTFRRLCTRPPRTSMCVGLADAMLALLVGR